MGSSISRCWVGRMELSSLVLLELEGKGDLAQYVMAGHEACTTYLHIVIAAVMGSVANSPVDIRAQTLL